MKNLFCNFSCPPPQKKLKIVSRTILKPADFHMSHLKRYPLSTIFVYFYPPFLDSFLPANPCHLITWSYQFYINPTQPKVQRKGKQAATRCFIRPDQGKETGNERGKGILGKGDWSSRDQSPCTARY